MTAYSFKRRFVAPIKVGLGLPIAPADLDNDCPTPVLPKTQTIRAVGKRRHARPGEVVQLYYAMRTKQCRKVGDGRCVSVDPVIIWPDAMAIMLDGKLMTARQVQIFARADGFTGADDMQMFWLDEHGPSKFEGFRIKWEPLK